jgi:hypothetical protein
MARLPGMTHVMQQSDGIVRLFEDGSERLVVAFDPIDGNAVASALDVIRGSGLGGEDRCFACFWAGYFHAHANRDPELARELFEDTEEGLVTVMAGEAEVVCFDPSDCHAVARAQLSIYDLALSEHDRNRAHFWSGFFYAHASGTDDGA